MYIFLLLTKNLEQMHFNYSNMYMYYLPGLHLKIRQFSIYRRH